MLNKAIKVLRIYHSFSQQDMAEGLGLSCAGYNTIELGKVDVNFARIKELASIYDMKPSQLIEFSECLLKPKKLARKFPELNQTDLLRAINNVLGQREAYEQT